MHGNDFISKHLFTSTCLVWGNILQCCMRHYTTVFSKMMTFCIILLFVVPLTSSGTNSLSTYEQIRDSILDFSISGFNLLAQNSPKHDNILFSPFSVYSVLMMAHLGARGKTAHQICHTLGLCHLNATVVHEAFGRLGKNLVSDSSLTDTLEIANGLFVQKGYNVSRYYEYGLRSLYSSTLQEMDFENDSLSALIGVNTWVSQFTEGKIQAVLHKNPSPLTKVMMVNAVHFRSQWKWQFDPQMTEPYGFFYIMPHHRIQIPIMSGRMNLALGHSRDVRASILELPFSQNRISMFLVLSDNPRQNLELNVTSVKNLIGTMKKRDVHVRLPRFTIDLSPQLTGLMWTLGIKDIFSPTEADLGGIAPGLFVTDMVHRALIQVDEKGSVASAATVGVVERMGHMDDNYFEANRPFIFMVMDKQSGAVLFMGRVANF